MSYATDVDRMENGWIPDTRTKCPDCDSKRFNGNLPCSWCETPDPAKAFGGLGSTWADPAVRRAVRETTAESEADR